MTSAANMDLIVLTIKMSSKIIIMSVYINDMCLRQRNIPKGGCLKFSRLRADSAVTSRPVADYPQRVLTIDIVDCRCTIVSMSIEPPVGAFVVLICSGASYNVCIL